METFPNRLLLIRKMYSQNLTGGKIYGYKYHISNNKINMLRRAAIAILSITKLIKLRSMKIHYQDLPYFNLACSHNSNVIVCRRRQKYARQMLQTMRNVRWTAKLLQIFKDSGQLGKEGTRTQWRANCWQIHCNTCDL